MGSGRWGWVRWRYLSHAMPVVGIIAVSIVLCALGQAWIAVVCLCASLAVSTWSNVVAEWLFDDMSDLATEAIGLASDAQRRTAEALTEIHRVNR